MRLEFFEIIFECTRHEYCEYCKYFNKECMEFVKCFDFKIPAMLWRESKSYDDLVKYEYDWRLYNEQTNK